MYKQCNSGNSTNQYAAKTAALGVVQRKKFKKFEITMEVGGWVQVSIGILLLLKIIPKYL